MFVIEAPFYFVFGFVCGLGSSEYDVLLVPYAAMHDAYCATMSRQLGPRSMGAQEKRVEWQVPKREYGDSSSNQNFITTL